MKAAYIMKETCDTSTTVCCEIDETEQLTIKPIPWKTKPPMMISRH